MEKKSPTASPPAVAKSASMTSIQKKPESSAVDLDWKVPLGQGIPATLYARKMEP
jgi:hypothetical protein